MNSALVLVTNRFDDSLRMRLPQIKGANFKYVKSLTEDATLLSQAQALIVRSSSKMDIDFFNKTSQLKFVVTATSGFDHIDLNAAKKCGVRVFHVPETQSVAAAELTIGMIINCCRKWPMAHRQIHRGDWQRSLLLGKQVSGSTLGIVGFGRVGEQVAVRAQALGVKVVTYDPFLEKDFPDGVTPLGFEEMMRSSDIVSMHVPKTKTTRHMIKKDTLEWMNTSAILINMSRGDVVNEIDLIEHLLEHPEFTAGLDVFAKEPLVLKSRFFDLNNVCLSPHIGASTGEALKNSSQAAVDKVLELLAGREVSGELPPQAMWWGS